MAEERVIESVVRPRAGREVVIDTRPIWVILAEKSVRPLLLLLGGALYWHLNGLPPPEGLSPEGMKALAVFSLCIIYWIFGVLPLMITSLLAIILIPLSGVMGASEAYALFGNEAVFFILGAFILAACMMKSGLSTRIAILILRRFGTSPVTLLLGIFLLNAFMSFFMSEHAVAAMNFAIIVEIVRVLRLAPGRSSYAKALFLAMAWGTTIGGVATLLGGGRAPLAIGILHEATGASFSFVEWALAAAPVSLAMLPIGYLVIRSFFPIDVTSIRQADELLEQKALALGRMSYEERAISLVVLLTFAAWVFLGEKVGLANIALSAVVVLFVFELVSWRQIEQYVNWGVILMYGGAICLGSALNKTGAAAWLSNMTIAHWTHSAPAVVAAIALVSIALTEAMSNSAVVALLMPVTLGVAAQAGMDPRVMALTVAVPAGLAFAFPIGTPANAIAYSSGFLRLRDILLPGLTLALSAWIVFNLIANFYWPLIGIDLAGSMLK